MRVYSKKGSLSKEVKILVKMKDVNDQAIPFVILKPGYPIKMDVALSKSNAVRTKVIVTLTVNVLEALFACQTVAHVTWDFINVQRAVSSTLAH